MGSFYILCCLPKVLLHGTAEFAALASILRGQVAEGQRVQSNLASFLTAPVEAKNTNGRSARIALHLYRNIVYVTELLQKCIGNKTGVRQLFEISQGIENTVSSMTMVTKGVCGSV